MHPHRYTAGQSSVKSKSRLEGKPSLLPKPRRPGSTDRLSTETRRPSTTSHRSSSAEPARGTFGARLSREASATKLPLNGRSRSQTSEARYGQAPTTPLRTSRYLRPTTTPVRTPSGDRNSRSWQTSLERALAFVTVKDLRPISNVAWQRSEYARVVEALAARGGEGGGKALVRPLTITQFVNIVGDLLAAVSRDAKLNNDNYVTKLPHLSKKLLYPGVVSKSWLRTVNTLHAFPHALALIAYLLDLVNDLETPVSDEWLYVGKDDLACLRREYLHKCWIRFQDPDPQYDELNEEYLQNLKSLLGDDEEKIVELQQIIKKYELALEDEVEQAARAEEARRVQRRDALSAALRAERAARANTHAQLNTLRAAAVDAAHALRALDVDIERAGVELQSVSAAVSAQSLSREARARVLDDVDYARRVHNSKTALAKQIAKMVFSKETELALWQKKTLDSCVEYKQGLIHLSAQFPALATLAVDEKSLMVPECSEQVSAAVCALKEQVSTLTTRRSALALEKSALARKRAADLEESRAKIQELKAAVSSESAALDADTRAEAGAAALSSARVSEQRARLARLRAAHAEYARAHTDLAYWQAQDAQWRSRLEELQKYVEEQRARTHRALDAARQRRTQLLRDTVAKWSQALGH